MNMFTKLCGGYAAKGVLGGRRSAEFVVKKPVRSLSNYHPVGSVGACVSRSCGVVFWMEAS